jgi:hypothetical protein
MKEGELEQIFSSPSNSYLHFIKEGELPKDGERIST